MTERMLNVRDVRLALGLSAHEVLKLVRTGKLRCYRYVGDGPVKREDVHGQTAGLRFRESDIEAMLEDCLVE
jgi:predicted DNA-binding transcriptional regulator AlpA